MRKDITIDCCCICKCVGQISDVYKELYDWLMTPNNDSKLMLSEKLHIEYIGSNNQLNVFLNQLLQMNKIQPVVENKEIKDFRNKHFNKKIENKLRSNSKDWNHIALVMISTRRIALSEDNNLIYDINNFPKFFASADNCPSKLPYK